MYIIAVITLILSSAVSGDLPTKSEMPDTTAELPKERIEEIVRERLPNFDKLCQEMRAPFIFTAQQEPEWMSPIVIRGRFLQYCDSAGKTIFLLAMDNVRVEDSPDGMAFQITIPTTNNEKARKMLRHLSVSLYRTDVIVMWHEIDKQRLAFDRRFPMKPRPPYASVRSGPQYLGE